MIRLVMLKKNPKNLPYRRKISLLRECSTKWSLGKGSGKESIGKLVMVSHHLVIRNFNSRVY